MAVPTFTMRQLLEAGVHFGHQTRRWNPRMSPYLFGARNGVHIIDLTQTVPMLHQALVTSRDVAASGGRVLFVGTKRQAQEPVARAAQRSGQYFVNHRWLGGMLTNWRTISQSIRRLRELEGKLAEGTIGLTKRETLQLTRERDKLERALGGIKDMGGLPDLLFVIDTNKESIAVAEAKVLNIPVIAVVDSNSDPQDISFPIPGNDDASRAINLYCDLMVGAVLDGIQAEVAASGADIGASEAVPEVVEPVVAEPEVAEPEAADAPAATDDAAAAPGDVAADAAAIAEVAEETVAAVGDSADGADEADAVADEPKASEAPAEIAAVEGAEGEPQKAAAAG
ncbi:MAG: 30S ribosomal protein S2 [Geminicoccaceae bacterium]